MKWFKTASTPPKGKLEDGFFGYSRTYDRLCHFLPTIDSNLRSISTGPYVSRFAFSNSAGPEHQIQVSWAGHSENDGSIQIKVEETEFNFGGQRKEGSYTVKTDKSHNFSGQDYFGTCIIAVDDLKKRTKTGLTPEGRWGLPLRMLRSK